MLLFQVGTIFFIPQETVTRFKIKSISDDVVTVSWMQDNKEVELELQTKTVNSFFSDGYWIKDIKEERKLKLNEIFKSTR